MNLHSRVQLPVLSFPFPVGKSPQPTLPCLRHQIAMKNHRLAPILKAQSSVKHGYPYKGNRMRLITNSAVSLELFHILESCGRRTGS